MRMLRLPLTTLAALVLCCSMGMLQTASAQDGYDDLGRPMLGVVMTPPSAGDLRNNDLEDSKGVVIRRVYGNSSAEEMGLQYGDIITEINGVEVNSMGTLRQIIQSYQPGDEVRVEGLRRGEPIESDGFLGDWPDNIPFHDIDENGEARYRDRVARRLARNEQRMARREETLNRLRQEEKDLEQEIADIKNAKEDSAGKNPLQRQALDAVDAIWSDDPEAVQQLSNLPSMRLQYGLKAGDAATDTVSGEPVDTDKADFSFGFAVSDNML